MAQPVPYDHPIAHKMWSMNTHLETLNAMYLTRRGLMSNEAEVTESDPFERHGAAPVARFDQFGRKPGQNITLRLLKQLVAGYTSTAAPAGTEPDERARRGTTLLIDKEEDIKFFQVVMWVEMLKNAVKSETPAMSDLRSDVKFDPTASKLLKFWIRNALEEVVLDGIYMGAAGHAIAEGRHAAEANKNIMWAGAATSQASIKPATILNHAELMAMSAWVQENNINPCMIDGDECYILLISPTAFNNLRGDANFINIYKDSTPRSAGGGSNPLTSKADFKFDDILIHKWNRIRRVSASDNNNENKTERALLLGSSSVGVGFASQPVMVPRQENAYRDIEGWAVKQILGSRISQFKDKDGANLFNQASAEWRFYRPAA